MQRVMSCGSRTHRRTKPPAAVAALRARFVAGFSRTFEPQRAEEGQPSFVGGEGSGPVHWALAGSCAPPIDRLLLPELALGRLEGSTRAIRRGLGALRRRPASVAASKGVPRPRRVSALRRRPASVARWTGGATSLPAAPSRASTVRGPSCAPAARSSSRAHEHVHPARAPSRA
jgi:hypothetical protein